MSSKPTTAAGAQSANPNRKSSRIFKGLIIATLAGSVLAIPACVKQATLPGTSWGNYKVVGKLGTNTCGSGINAESPWNFSAEMSLDGSTLYFAHADGSDEVTGSFDTSDDTSATLASVVTENVDGDDAGNLGSCNLTLGSSLALKLGTASPPKSFTGTAVFTYTVATSVSSNTNCTDQLSAAGGKYSTLPCTVNYTLTATQE